MLGSPGGISSAGSGGWGCHCLECRDLIRAEVCSRVCFIFNCFWRGEDGVGLSLLQPLPRASCGWLSSALAPSPLSRVDWRPGRPQMQSQQHTEIGQMAVLVVV